jgi:hypothetical protein
MKHDQADYSGVGPTVKATTHGVRRRTETPQLSKLLRLYCGGPMMSWTDEGWLDDDKRLKR